MIWGVLQFPGSCDERDAQHACELAGTETRLIWQDETDLKGVDGVIVPQADPMVYRPIFWAGTHGTGEHPRYGGWGGAQADETPFGETISIGGRRFDTGIGILENSRLEVRNARYARFSAFVGVDDSARNRRQPVTFIVYGDGKLLAKSKPMRAGELGTAGIG